MPNRSLWNLDLPRAEYDNRARETRLRLEQSERLFAKRDAVEGYRCLRLLLLFLGNIVGGSQRRGRRTRSPDDKLPCQIGMLRPIPVFVRQPAGYSSTIRAKPSGGMH